MSRETVPLWRFLGDISTPGPDGDLTPHLGKKEIALLAYLALARESVSRDEVANLLWPADPSRSKHNLRQCVHSLKQAFGGGFDSVFEISNRRLALNHAAVDVDARGLLEIDAGKVVTAEELLDLCRGPFLRELTTRAQPFDDWALAQRDRLTGAAERALGAARAAAERAGRESEAVRLIAALADLGAGSAGVPAAEKQPPPILTAPRRQRWMRYAALILGGAAFAGVAVAVGTLIGAYFASPGVRDWVASVVTGEPLRPRIAVLPFTTVNGTAEEDSLAGGVTLGVNYGLYAITAKELFVVTTVTKPQELSQEELMLRAKGLNVRYLITGSVAVEGATVRVDAQRLDTERSAGDHVWREEFNKPTAETIFKLQDDITRWILEGLDIEVSDAGRNRIQYLADTDDLDAWLAAADGVRHLIRINKQDLEIARAYYQKALDIDENYISARRGLAWVAFLSARLGLVDDARGAIQEAQRNLEIVLRKRPDDGTTKSLHGAILLLKGEYDEAIEAGEFARERLPGSADVSAVLAHTLTYVGEHKKALKLIDDAMKLSPMHPGFYRWTKGRALRMANRFIYSIEELEKDLGRGEPAMVHLVELTASYSAAGRMADARMTAAKIKQLDDDFSAEAWLQHPRIKIPEIQQKELKYLTDAGL